MMTDTSFLGYFSGAAFLFLAIFFLGASIFVHELGHFLAARRRGLKVERFSIGFGPAIYKWRGKDGVEYRLSWLPFGGYVALPELADMGRLEGGNQEKDPAAQGKRVSYSDKMITLVMGAFFNLLFAFVLSLFLWFAGQDVAASTQQTRIGSVSETLTSFGMPDQPSPAFVAGLQAGDEVLAVDGNPIADWQELTYRIVTGLGRDQEGRPVTVFTVRRGEEAFDVTLYPVLVTREDRRLVGISPIDIFEASGVDRDSPAYQAGFREGDVFLAYDGIPVTSYHTLRRYVIDNPGQPIDFTLQRGEQTIQVSYAPTLQVEPRTGQQVVEWGFTPVHRLETIYPNPVTQFAEKMQLFYLTLRALVSPTSDVRMRNMSGPVGIIDNLQMVASINIKQAIWFLVFININLAILNLLPIPVLDGGHMVFATISKIIGRPLPQRFLESTQAAFVLLLFSLMIYVTFFDVGRLRDRFFPENEVTEPATPEEP